MLAPLGSSLATLKKCQLLSYDVEKYDAKTLTPGPGKSTALLSAFRNGLSTFLCFCVLLAGGESAESR